MINIDATILLNWIQVHVQRTIQISKLRYRVQHTKKKKINECDTTKQKNERQKPYNHLNAEQHLTTFNIHLWSKYLN